MLRLAALEKLQEIGKTKYWLNKQLGMSGQNLNRMLNNETESIRYEVLESLCVIFGCTPNDLLVFDEDQPEGNQ